MKIFWAYVRAFCHSLWTSHRICETGDIEGSAANPTKTTLREMECNDCKKVFYP